MGGFAQVAEAKHPPYTCMLIPGAAGPYLSFGERGYMSATGLIKQIGSAGWPTPDEFEPLQEKLAAAELRIRQLEAELANAAVDAEKLAAAEEIIANQKRNAALAAQF